MTRGIEARTLLGVYALESAAAASAHSCVHVVRHQQ